MTLAQRISLLLRMEPGLLGLTKVPFAVTPHNSTNFDTPARYLYVGEGGNVTIVCLDDTTVQYVGVPTGGYILAPCKRVNSTGTTAASIVGHQ